MEQVLSDLKCVEKSDDPDSSFAVGFGMHYKIMDLKAGFNPLDTKEVCRSYRNARHRLILLDWGGTLVATQEKSDKLQAYAMATGHAERDSLSPELRAVLEVLASDVKNNIFVVSGKEQPAVAQYFGSIKVHTVLMLLIYSRKQSVLNFRVMNIIFKHNFVSVSVCCHIIF